MGLFSLGLGIGAGAVGGIAQAAGGALRGAGEAIGGGLKGLGEAVGGALKQPDVTINQMGMVGSAGQQAVKVVTGGGTLPARKNISKPAINNKMPTEKLLQIAVGYLESIDSSLKQQIDFQVQSSREQAQAQKENDIEAKSSRFSEYADRFKAGVGNKVDAAKNGAMNAGVSLLKIAGMGAAIAAALKLGSMDTKELDALKKNIDNFQEKFGWIEEIAAAGGMGMWLFGPRGAMIAMAGDIVWQGLRKLGLAPNSAAGVVATGAIGYAGFRIAKAGGKLASRQFASKFIASKAARAAVVRGTTKASTFALFKSPGWRRFIAWLAKKGMGKLVVKINTRIAIAMASAAVAATGAGAVFGAIGILLDIGLSLYTMYEVYELYQQWTAEEEAEKKGAGDQDISDATKESGPVAAGSKLANNLVVSAPSETGDPEKATAWFMSSEGGGYTKEQAAGIVGNLFVESGLKTDAVGDSGAAYGIAQWHPDRQAKFKSVFGKDIRESNFDEQLKFVTWELNNNENRADQMIRSATTAADAAAAVDQHYERSSGAARENRIANANNIASGNFKDLQGGGTAGKSIVSQGVEGIADIVKGMARIADTNSTPLKNGISSIAEANRGNYYADRIQSQAVSDEAALRGTAQKKKDQQAASERMSIGKRIAAANAGKMETLDPNYQVDPNNVISKYFIHFGLDA